MIKHSKNSLIEMMRKKTHAAIGDVQFDCPTIVFSPHHEVIDSYGTKTFVAVKNTYKPIASLLYYSENDLLRLKSCVTRFHKQKLRESNLKNAFTYGKRVSQELLN